MKKCGLIVLPGLVAVHLFAGGDVLAADQTSPGTGATGQPGPGGTGPGKRLHLGRVIEVEKDVKGQDGKAQPVPIAVNDAVYPRQKIITGPGSRAVIQFRDGSTFSIGPDSQIVLNQFAFNPAESRAEKSVQVVSGAFRYLSGFAVKDSNVRIDTTTATMGVRGSAVEGVVAQGVPDFINVANGEVALKTQKGEVKVQQGQSSAAFDVAKPPADPKIITPAMALQAVKHIQKEVGVGLPKARPLTKEQILADAQVNRLGFVEQGGTPVAAKPATGTREIPKSGPAKTGLDKKGQKSGAGKGHEAVDEILGAPKPGDLSQWLRDLEEKVGLWQRAIANSVSFIREAAAANLDEVAAAVTILVEAQKMGVLGVSPANMTPAQKDFIAKVNATNPGAAAALQQSNTQQQANNQTTSTAGTQQVISGSAQVAVNPAEVAKVVAAAVAAVDKATAGTSIVSVIVTSSLSAQGITNNAEAATVITAAAAKSDPTVAAEAASAAVKGLPATEAAKATGSVAAAAASASPQQASQIASAMAAVLPPNAAPQVAAAIVQVVNKSEASKVAAAVVNNTSTNAQAVAVAAAVAQVIGKNDTSVSAAVAAAVTQKVGSQSASAVAAGVVQVAGANSAKEVGQAVGSVANTKAAEVASVLMQLVPVSEREMVKASTAAGAKTTVASIETGMKNVSQQQVNTVLQQASVAKEAAVTTAQQATRDAAESQKATKQVQDVIPKAEQQRTDDKTKTDQKQDAKKDDAKKDDAKKDDAKKDDAKKEPAEEKLGNKEEEKIKEEAKEEKQEQKEQKEEEKPKTKPDDKETASPS
ncbi:MAG: FecR family protein [Magnetococcus sp. DMHC-1]